MNVADVMTRTVVTVGPETSVAEIAALLVEHRISAVPVVDPAGRLIGLVGEADLLHRAETGTELQRPWWLELFADPDARAEAFIKAHGRTAREVMVAEVEVIAPDAPLGAAAELMHRRHVKRLPVVADGKLQGIVSRADLIKALTRVPQPGAPATVDDLAIKDRFEATAKAAGFATVGSVTVSVEGGIVHLWGLVATATERRALAVAAAEIPGVQGVENHLVVREGFPLGGL